MSGDFVGAGYDRNASRVCRCDSILRVLEGEGTLGVNLHQFQGSEIQIRRGFASGRVFPANRHLEIIGQTELLDKVIHPRVERA